MSNTWKQEPEIPLAKDICALLLYAGKIYAFDALNSPIDVHFYDLASGTWASAPDTISSNYGTYTMANDKIFRIGGAEHNETTTSAKVICYDPLTGAVEERASMRENRVHHAAIYTNSKIYVFGGRGGSGNSVNRNSLEIYDIASDTWSAGASMPEAKQAMAAALAGNKIYVFGGICKAAAGPDVYTGTAEVYDIAANTWSAIASLPIPMASSQGTAHNGKIYLCGGRTSATGVATQALASAQVLIYDIASGSYTYGPPLPEARIHMGTVVANNRLYVAGGMGNPYNVATSMISLELEPADDPGEDPGTNPGGSCCKPHLNIKITNCTKALARDLLNALENHDLCEGACREV